MNSHHFIAKNLLSEGIRLFEAREFTAALEPLNAAITHDPNLGDAWCCRGLVLGHLKRHNKRFQKLLKL